MLRAFIILLCYLLFVNFAIANDDYIKKVIMVVNFELRDVSPLPNVIQEQERTKVVENTIKKILAENNYTIVSACAELQEANEQGLGYLYDRPEVAAKIGNHCEADYVLLGQTWKPSFLFVFPQVQIIDTRKNLTREQLVLVSRVVQLEASMVDKNVTENAGRKLAVFIIEKLSGL